MKKISLLLWCFALTSIVLVWCTTPNQVENTPTPTTMLTPSQEVAWYKIYSDEAFDAAITEWKVVVLNFRASRCPTCTKVSNDILAKISNLPDNVVIFETDYDKYPALKSDYNVEQQTTFVFFDENGEYTKTVETIRSFEDVVSNL